MAGETPDLGYAARLEPKDAIAYLEAKGQQISFDFHELKDAAHATSFTVAKAMRAEVLGTIHQGMKEAVAQGLPYEEFRKRMEPKLRAQGWWGKQVVVNPEGRAQVVQLGSPGRLKTIYQTNMSAAYNAGRYKQQKENSDNQPYWQYIAILDGVTRPSHAALHGKVFRHDDPIWDTIYPPNGYNCRCQVNALSQRRLDANGLKPESSEGALSTQQVDAGVDTRTGEVVQKEVTVWRGKDRTGKDATFRTDPGFNVNPGEAAFGKDVAVLRKLSAIEDPGIRTQAVQALNNSELRQQAFRSWAHGVLEQRLPGNTAQTLHIMEERVADFARTKGFEAARILVMSEKSLVHATTATKRAEGIALSDAELVDLPPLLPYAEVFWDAKNENLLYAAMLSDKETALIPVTLNRKIKKYQGRVDEVVNAFKIRDRRLQTDRKRFTPLRGDGAP